MGVPKNARKKARKNSKGGYNTHILNFNPYNKCNNYRRNLSVAVTGEYNKAMRMLPDVEIL